MSQGDAEFSGPEEANSGLNSESSSISKGISEDNKNPTVLIHSDEDINQLHLSGQQFGYPNSEHTKQPQIHILQNDLQRNTENWKGPKLPGQINYGAAIQWATLQL